MSYRKSFYLGRRAGRIVAHHQTRVHDGWFDLDPSAVNTDAWQAGYHLETEKRPDHTGFRVSPQSATTFIGDGLIITSYGDGETWELWHVHQKPVDEDGIFDMTDMPAYRGPGLAFAGEPWTTETETAITVHQTGGLDI